MPMFKKKPVIVEANQWFKNGDHPLDKVAFLMGSDGYQFLTEGKIVRYYRHPNVDGKSLCSYCNNQYHVHGWIDNKGDGHTVCPGDWIVAIAKK